MSELDTSQSKKLNEKQLLEFCVMHPEDPVFRLQLAEYYQSVGRELRSIYAARKSHALFLKEKNKIQANHLLKKFGADADSRTAKKLVSQAFVRLSNDMSVVHKRMKQVLLKEGQVLFQEGDSVDYVYLVIDGALAVVNKVDNKHELLLLLEAGSLVFEYDVNGEAHLFNAEMQALDDDVEEEQPTTKTVMYRGVKTVVVDDSPKPQQKPKMYRGAVVSESSEHEKQASHGTKHTTYRGNEVDNIVLHQHRYATVLAQKACTLIKFTPQDIEKVLKSYPELHQTFIEEAETRLKLSKIGASKLFTCLPISLRALIAKRASLVSYKTDDVLKNANAFMKNIKLVVAGHVKLYHKNAAGEHTYCGRLSVGELLGVEHLMSEQASPIVYQAEQGCQTVDIDFLVFKDALSLSEKFRTVIRAYYAKTTTKLLRANVLWSEDD